MAGLNDILSTARDALSAQQFGISVTGQNIANVNTPGYVRREAVLTSRALGGRSFGTVEASLRRSADQYASQRYLSATGLSSAAGERDSQLSAVESVLNDFAGAGLGASLDELFASFSALASNPGDPSLRANVLASAERFATQSQDLARQLGDVRANLYQTATSVADQVGEHAANIADLNVQIATAVAQGQDAADLQDRRAQELEALATLVDIETVPSEDGQLSVQATGTTLVDKSFHRSLAVSVDGDGNLQILATTPSGSSSDVTSFLEGGRLAGIVEVRDSDVVAVANRLDQLVFDVANAVNTQHSAGFGLDGAGGRNLFAVAAAPQGAAATIELDPAIAGQPSFVAASGTAGGVPGDSDNAVALGVLAEARFANSNTQTAGEAYAGLVSDVGRRKSQAASDAATRGAITEQAFQLRESLSGVSLDEEFIALTRFQRAFQAASQVLAAVDEMYEELLGVVR